MEQTLDLAAAVSEWRAIAEQARKLHEDLPPDLRASIEANGAGLDAVAPAVAALPAGEHRRAIQVLEGLADVLEAVLVGTAVSLPTQRRCPAHQRTARLGS